MARRKNKDHGDMLYATDRYATAFFYAFLKDDGTEGGVLRGRL